MFKTGDRGVRVLAVQSMLDELGYDPGPLDEIWGPLTQAALDQFIADCQNGSSEVLAWGKRVSPEFRARVIAIGARLGADPNELMAVMAFESGRTFSPSIRNAAGSGATGLIQFMPSTAHALGTTTAELARMNAIEQLEYVEKYFRPSMGRLTSLEDVYMAVLWPAGVGKPLDYVLFDRSDSAHPKRYIQNRGLDFNRDGKITKREAAAKVRAALEEGLLPENAG